MVKRRRRESDLDLITIITPKPQAGFVETVRVAELTNRCLRYLKAGFPAHLSGPTGCGKTTLAMHVASKLERPVVLINGDEEYSTSSLVGGEMGYKKKKVVDRFVSRVIKVEEEYKKSWVDERLTAACKYGFTLVYNEYTRSRPEANNILLSVLEERILPLPAIATKSVKNSYIKVHPSFSAIFTSNPEEYAGIYQAADALNDRMITINMDYYDAVTEAEITEAKSGLLYTDAVAIVSLVRRIRESGLCEHVPTLRSCIVIASSIEGLADPSFRQTCIDVLSPKIGSGGGVDPETVIDDMLKEEGITCLKQASSVPFAMAKD